MAVLWSGLTALAAGAGPEPDELDEPEPAGWTSLLREQADQVSAWEEMFERPSRDLGTPAKLLAAIAKVESGFKPWSLNVEGRPYIFDSKAEALGKAREAWDAGRSFDVGLMQVNRWWLSRFGVSLEAALDPLANVYLGGWILKRELERRGSVREAIGAYHSPDPARAGRYADLVLGALARGPQPVRKASARRAGPVEASGSVEASGPAAASPMTVWSPRAVLAAGGLSAFNGQTMKVKAKGD